MAAEGSTTNAASLHASSLIIDALAGRIIHPEPPVIDGKTYLDRLIEANVRVVNLTIAAHSDSFEAALMGMFHYFNLLQVEKDRLIHIKTVDDIERAHRERKLGLIFGFQSPTPIGTSFYRWTIFHQLGLRVCQLAYNEGNALAHGCYEPANGGLTFHGQQAVHEMNRLGIVVDLSHVGERSTLDAMEISERPCIFSHSNPKALTPTSKRNITDERIRRVAETGGVVGLSPHGFMVHKAVGVQANLSDYLDHFEYVTELVGIDHVGIGTDVYESYTKFAWESSTKLFYNSPWTYETVWNGGFNKISQFPKVTEGLLSRGFSEDDVRKILGGNFLRSLQRGLGLSTGTVWRVPSGRTARANLT